MVYDLNQIVQPGETLATHDIGAVAYLGNFPVIDLVGLVNPDVIDYHKGRRVREYLEEVRPNYLLIFPDWDAYFLRIDPASEPDTYELVKVYAGGALRGMPYVLYRVHYQ